MDLTPVERLTALIRTAVTTNATDVVVHAGESPWFSARGLTVWREPEHGTLSEREVSEFIDLALEHDSRKRAEFESTGVGRNDIVIDGRPYRASFRRAGAGPASLSITFIGCTRP